MNRVSIIVLNKIIRKEIISLDFIFLYKTVIRKVTNIIEKGCSMYVNLSDEFFIIPAIPKSLKASKKPEVNTSITIPTRSCRWKVIITSNEDTRRSLVIFPE